jgi:hypothetical protein
MKKKIRPGMEKFVLMLVIESYLQLLRNQCYRYYSSAVLRIQIPGYKIYIKVTFLGKKGGVINLLAALGMWWLSWLRQLGESDCYAAVPGSIPASPTVS